MSKIKYHIINFLTTYNLHLKSYFTLFIVHCSLFIVVCSCSLENKVARDFANKHSNIKVYVFKPAYLFKVNIKEDSIANIDNLPQEKKDSITIVNSIFLKNINDSLLISKYYNSLVDELKLYGVKVLTDSSNEKYYKSDTNTYVFNISQVELDEDLIPFEDKMEVDTSWYVQTFELNSVALDSWFEYKNLNSFQNKTKVLFAEHTASDIINGGFQSDIFHYHINYRYKRNDINLDDIYQLAIYAGMRNAAYIFDYILNDYIRQQLKAKNYPNPSVYYHYNRFYNYLTPANDDRFVPVK